MTIHDILTASKSIAALSVDDGQLAIHGVILGEDDVTTGLSGKRTRWPAEILRELAPMAEGKPITMADSLDPEQHVGVEVTEDGPRLTGAVSMNEKVGEITSTVYEDGVGILYEGFVSDWDAEDAIESGLAQVSPVIVRNLELVEGDEDDTDALYEPVEVGGFRDLAIVADGAAPSNEIQAGAMPEGSASATAEALSSHFGVEVEALTGGTGGDNTGGDDGQDGGDGQSTRSGTTTSKTTMEDYDDLSDRQRELLARAAQMDNPTVVEADDEERLTEHEELIDEAEDLDDPTVESEEQVAAMQDRLGTVEAMFDEALIEEKGLRENTVEAMSFEAKASEFETDEGDLDLEALTQQPETGGTPSDDGGDGGVDIEALSSDERDEIGSLMSRAETFDTVDPEHAESLRQEAADIAGAEDSEELVEVL